MERYSQFYNPFLSGSDPWSLSSSSSSSNLEGMMMSSSSSSTRRVDFLEEEIMLASCNPKKRDGRKKFKETRHPVYRGVRSRDSGKWVCEVREPNKKTRIWLGSFPTAEMAARAHDVAAIALRGRLACVNFADSFWRLPVPISSDAKDIQKAATMAAESFRPLRKTELVEETMALPENVFLVDEDEEFAMPELIANMAEGMLLAPPDCPEGAYCCNDMEFVADVSLWSYSM